MVEWAGLEIRSLSQDRGFESLSLLETKSEAERLRFLFQQNSWQMRTLAEQKHHFSLSFQLQNAKFL